MRRDTGVGIALRRPCSALAYEVVRQRQRAGQQREAGHCLGEWGDRDDDRWHRRDGPRGGTGTTGTGGAAAGAIPAASVTGAASATGAASGAATGAAGAMASTGDATGGGATGAGAGGTTWAAS